MEQSLRLHCGELVEVRSMEEILRTLDASGKLDGLPFMAEMMRFCGGTYRVFKRADRTCCPPYKARGMNDTVWLEDVRCDGSSHEGCGAFCAFFWKEAWLKRAPANAVVADAKPAADLVPLQTKTRDQETGKYLCQASELPGATYPLGIRGNLRTYAMDLWYGNFTLKEFFKVNLLWAWAKLPPYKKGKRCTWLVGTLTKTPTESLDLQPGELVEVKSLDEIMATLSTFGQNRGLAFQPEMREFCGKRYRVLARLNCIINELNGEMIKSKNTVLLNSVTCDGVCRRGCGRRGYTYWREIWLRRVTDGDATAAPSASS